MRIENLRSETRQGRARVAATVIWEDCNRPVEEVYFETEEQYAGGLSCNPHAFLVGCIVPAMHYGEKRVAMDAEICPRLRSGVITALSWLRHWYYGPDRELVQIEARIQSRTPKPSTPERAGVFYSGGIDSFAALRDNRLNFSAEHPGSIKDGLLVYGLELDDHKAFEYVKDSLTGVASEAGLTLIPVYTNVYLNYRDEDARNDFNFWASEFMDAALASVAHAFSRRLTTVSIAAGDNITTMRPHGSHPMLGPNYSSQDLIIRLEGFAQTRLDKTRLLSDWDVALQNLRVCNQSVLYNQDNINCGHCEKCIRTMLALMALGALDRSRSFKEKDISAKQIRKAVSTDESPYIEKCYMELVEPLRKIGRHDLAAEIRYKFTLGKSLNNISKSIKRLDHIVLNDGLKRLKQSIMPTK